MRLALRQVRLRINDVINISKDEHHRRCQVYTKTRGHINNLFEAEENYLQAQEDFEKNEQARLRDALRQIRIDELVALEIEQMPPLDLAEYSEEGYQEIKAAARTAFEFKKAEAVRIENERILREAAASRKLERVQRLSVLGLNFNGTDYKLEHVTLSAEMVGEADDATFETAVANITPAITTIQERRANAAALAERKEKRLRQISSLGLTYDAITAAYVLADSTSAIPAEFVDTAEDAEWLVKIEIVEAAVTQLKVKMAAEKREAEELAANKAVEQLKAEVKRTAPDREKLLILADEIAAIVAPEVDAKFAPFVGEIEMDLQATATKIRNFVANASN